MPRGGGCTLIFSYIRRLVSFNLVQILNFNIFWCFQKNKYFFGYEDFVDIFGVITKLDYIVLPRYFDHVYIFVFVNIKIKTWELFTCNGWQHTIRL